MTEAHLERAQFLHPDGAAELSACVALVESVNYKGSEYQSHRIKSSPRVARPRLGARKDRGQGGWGYWITSAHGAGALNSGPHYWAHALPLSHTFNPLDVLSSPPTYIIRPTLVSAQSEFPWLQETIGSRIL